jgi:large subunit ribosomal protein L13
MKTILLKSSEIKREWYLIDAKGKPLGRLASRIAKILMGKHKPAYTPNIDTGDYVVVVNASKVMLTGRKENTKIYYRYSGYVGGMKETVFKDMIKKHPTYPIEKAVKGMLPKNRLAKRMLKKLFLFPEESHNFVNKPLKPLEI